MLREIFALPVAIIFASFALTLLLTRVCRQLLIARAIFDIPNERSSHVIPVPRGGGWALVAVILFGLGAAAVFIDRDARHLGLLLGCVILIAISWQDDKAPVHPGLRLLAHFAAATLGSLSLPDHAQLFARHLPFWIDRMVLVIGWTWFINLYNFMDGIDGITCVETISVATGIALALSVIGQSDPFLQCVTAVLTGSALGFLVYNWHPAKIFMGDVGSVPLGFVLGFALLVLAVSGHLATATILPLYYLADSGLTLLKRAWRRERVWQAHRQHFYQRAALKLGNHAKIVVRVLAANCCLVGLGLCALVYPWTAALGAILIVAVLLQNMHKSASQP